MLTLYYGPNDTPVRLTNLEAVALADFLDYLGATDADAIRALWPHAAHTSGPRAALRAVVKLSGAIALYQDKGNA